MKRKSKIRRNSQEEIKEKIFFMSAYNINKFERKFSLVFKKNAMKELLSQYHISSILVNDILCMKDKKYRVNTYYDTYNCCTSYKFESLAMDVQEDYQNIISQMSWVTSIKHSENVLLDEKCFKISFVIEMESFLAQLEKGVFKIKPRAFFINEMMIVFYEVINYENGKSLNKDDILGRHNNFNIMPVKALRYTDEKDFLMEGGSISEIIYRNITCFLETLLHNKYQMDTFSFVHNTFVVSNSISDITKYFQKVLGVEDVQLSLTNLNTNNAYKYYSLEYMGVVTDISRQDVHQNLYDCLLLEAIKMYSCLKMIIGYEIKDKLDDTLNNQLNVERLFYMGKVPIITLNVLDNIKKMESFKRYKDANEFKISYFKLKQEYKKNQNELFLNILLYILALISGVSTLQVLETEFGWPFEISFIVLIIVFVGLGLFWIWNRKNEDK